jgi:hypothetical protein
MIFSRNPPLMPHEEDTPAELSPIFSFLNIHTNKVYQEGYFLKLNDQDSRMFEPCDIGANLFIPWSLLLVCGGIVG